ncbi:MAG: DUF3489 domain-containing protein [Rhizomicrobium sp.]
MRKSITSSPATKTKTIAKGHQKSRLCAKRKTKNHLRITGVVAAAKPSPSPDSKLGSIITLLRRPNGASIGDLCKATGWQAHSVRGALSGAIKKKLGLALTTEKTAGTRLYRIAG